MDSKVQKIAYYDSRVVQKQPRYGIQKGCLSITNHKSSAISSTSNSANWSVNLPSLNVNLDRQVRWYGDVILKFNVNRADWGGGDGKTPSIPFEEKKLPLVLQYQKDWCWNSFPLHRCVNSMSATINDAVVTQSTSSVMSELLRLRQLEAGEINEHIRAAQRWHPKCC